MSNESDQQRETFTLTGLTQAELDYINSRGCSAEQYIEQLIQTAYNQELDDPRIAAARRYASQP